ncbi:hypothetical protein CsSME_00004356 [Camellia sinensis var. sinensis]
MEFIVLTSRAFNSFKSENIYFSLIDPITVLKLRLTKAGVAFCNNVCYMLRENPGSVSGLKSSEMP